jgi:hypothetical protein
MENNRLSALFFKKPAPSGFFAEDQRGAGFRSFLCIFLFGGGNHSPENLAQEGLAWSRHRRANLPSDLIFNDRREYKNGSTRSGAEQSASGGKACFLGSDSWSGLCPQEVPVSYLLDSTKTMAILVKSVMSNLSTETI